MADSTGSTRELDVLEIALIIAKARRPIVLRSVGVALLVLLVALFVPNTYTASIIILPPQPPNSAAGMLARQLGVLPGIEGGSSLLRTPEAAYVTMLESNALRRALVEREQLVAAYGVASMQDARDLLRKRTRVIADVKKGTIRIAVDDQSPERAARVANAFASELQALTQRLAVTEAEQRQKFYERQREIAAGRLRAAERAVRRASGFGRGYALLRLLPNTDIEAAARLNASVAALEMQLRSLKQYLGDRHPDVMRTKAQLDAAREQLGATEGGVLAISKSDTSPEAEFVRLFKEYKYRESIFDGINAQIIGARMDAAREGAVVQVIDPAEVPLRKSGPRRLLIATIAGGATFAFGVGLLLIGALLKRTARDGQRTTHLLELQQEWSLIVQQVQSALPSILKWPRA